MSKNKNSWLQAMQWIAVVALMVLVPLVLFMYFLPASEKPGEQEESQVKEEHEQLSPGPTRAWLESTADGADVPNESTEPSGRTPERDAVSHEAPIQSLPIAASIQPGMEKSKLLGSFGPPNLISTKVTGGQSMETFHYLHPEAGTETIVQLRSGVVVSATTTVY